MTDSCRQFSACGQVFLYLQLQVRFSAPSSRFCSVFRIFLLWLLIMEAIFGIVEYDILIVDLLIYFSSGVFAKCLSMRDRNFLPTFVLTFWQ